MSSLGLFRFIHLGLELTVAMQETLEEVRYIVSWFDLLYLERPYERWAVYFLTLCETLSDEQFWGACTRLAVSEHYKERLAEMRKQGEELIGEMERRLARQGKLENSEVYFFLRGLPVEVLLYHMAKCRSSELKRFISLYFTKLHGVRTQIGGEDLKQLGVERGPRYRELLDAVLSAKLNGEVVNRDDEIELVRELLKAP